MDDAFFSVSNIGEGVLGRGVSISKDDIKGVFCFFPLFPPSIVPSSPALLAGWRQDKTQSLLVEYGLCASFLR